MEYDFYILHVFILTTYHHSDQISWKSERVTWGTTGWFDMEWPYYIIILIYILYSELIEINLLLLKFICSKTYYSSECYSVLYYFLVNNIVYFPIRWHFRNWSTVECAEGQHSTFWKIHGTAQTLLLWLQVSCLNVMFSFRGRKVEPIYLSPIYFCL